MFVEIPQNLILMTAGAFLLGWLLSSISSSLGSKYHAKKRDPRDDRIRSLEAELRIAQTEGEKAREQIEKLEAEVEESTSGLERRDHVITKQHSNVEKLTRDLKESVIKTRELRGELADRATENVHAEAKIREVETELSVAQASTDMIATGVLDYKFANDDDEIQDSDEDGEKSGVSKAAT